MNQCAQGSQYVACYYAPQSAANYGPSDAVHPIGTQPTSCMAVTNRLSHEK